MVWCRITLSKVHAALAFLISIINKEKAYEKCDPRDKGKCQIDVDHPRTNFNDIARELHNVNGTRICDYGRVNVNNGFANRGLDLSCVSLECINYMGNMLTSVLISLRRRMRFWRALWEMILYFGRSDFTTVVKPQAGNRRQCSLVQTMLVMRLGSYC